MPSKDKYTDPELREQVKEEIKAGDKGGKPGQWSARKAQMMASEYKKRGGDYTTDKKDQDESQKNLSKWGEEEWQTKEGSGNAKQEDGTEKRYLPKKAWKNMTEEEKNETDEKKQKGSKEGKQYVSNTEKAKESRKKANEEEAAEYDNKKLAEQGSDDEAMSEDGDDADIGVDAEQGQNEEGQDEVDKQNTDAEEYQPSEDEIAGDVDGVEDNEEEEEKGKNSQDRNARDKRTPKATKGGIDNDKAEVGKKRSRPSEDQISPNKKQKDASGKQRQNGTNGTTGSEHNGDEQSPKPGSKDRLPEKGQKVKWKAPSGYVEGEVIEIVHEEKEVDGKHVKATDSDPRIVLKSSSSGKTAVHKPDAVYFD
ncbi:hypothetical protein M501DRAFT_997048 [Patellaria atrata CBS 101060]|uniref:Hypervirulence associated protein TUDOR domain-containing protein n=1 Tax=Patellaria atrata CBS 101060 TaxID=1346257 RepID=A0A9P4S5B5_9PEZI|nr:hypothetical protein M501DRAFT_997048 [Patellaria atrata CBS 101060]